MISQKDLALTQFGFMGLTVIKKKMFGIKGNVEDVEGFVHFWRTIGYYMGIEDRSVSVGNYFEPRNIMRKYSVTKYSM